MYNRASNGRSYSNISKGSNSKLKDKSSVKIKCIEVDRKSRNKGIIIDAITGNGGNKLTTGLIVYHRLKDKHINNINNHDERHQHHHNQTPSLMIII